MRLPPPVRRASRSPIASSDTSPVCSPTISPSYMTRMRSESERISSSSSETRRIARPSSRSVTSRRWRYSIAPTSRPRVGCAAISDLRVAIDLPRRHELLLVAARQAAGAREGPAAAHVELANQASARARPSGRGRSSPSVESGGLRVVVQRDVLGDRELEHEPAALAVLGDVADPGVERRPRVGVREFAAGDASPSRSRSAAGR